MRLARTWAVVCSLLLALQGFAQTTTSTANQGVLLLQRGLMALASNTQISDITLSGTARRIAGSEDESGTVVIKALSGTGSLLSLSLPSGTRSEARNLSVQPFVGSWSGPDGVAHAVAYHNLLVDPSWFPTFTIASVLSAPNTTVIYVGEETRNSQLVLHMSTSEQPPSGVDTDGLLQHLTQMDIYLNSSTFLPAAITFSIHPDTNANLDIPVEVDFSSYEVVSGSQIPFHIQRFVNNSLFLDLQFNSALLNSGISPSAFAVSNGH